VYFICIFLANLTLLKLHNNLTGWGELLMFLCASSYFWLVAIESQIPAFSSVYKFMAESVSSYSAWLGALLCFASVFTIDVMLTSVKEWVAARNKRVRPD